MHHTQNKPGTYCALLLYIAYDIDIYHSVITIQMPLTAMPDMFKDKSRIGYLQV